MTLHTYSDGGARGNPGPAAIGVVLCDAKGTVLMESSHAIGKATNNEAEYRAMLMALELAHKRKAQRLICHADSELIVYQLQGIYKIKEPRMKALADEVRKRAAHFDTVIFKQVFRSHLMITRADKPLNQTLNRAKLKKSGVKRKRELMQGELF